MRLDLRGAEERRRRGKGRARSKTFETALARPRIRPRGRKEKRRVRRKRPPRPRPSQTDVAAAVETPRFRWQALFRRLPVAMLLLGLIGLLAYGSTDASFFIYEASVVGAEHLDAAMLYQVAGIHEMNIFWIRPEEVEARLEAVDGIKAAHVRCDLFPARVAIQVEERQPLVLWRAQAQGRDWWLDEEGVVLPYHGDPADPNVLFVVDSSDRVLAVGQTLQPPGLAASVRRLAEALPGIRVFFYEAERGLGFYQVQDGKQWAVYVGGSENLERKIQALRALSDYLSAHNIQPRYVDVRWPEHLVYGQ